MSDSIKAESPIAAVVACGRAWRWLLLIALAALLLRAGRCLVDDWVTKDSVLYVEMARDWGGTAGLAQAFSRNPRIPPLYVGLMAAGERLGWDAEITGLLVSLLAGALLPVAVFLLASKVWTDQRLALLAAALAAAHPLLVRNSAEVMREGLYLALFATALAAAAAGMSETRRRRWWAWLLAGLATALAAATRDEGGELLLVLAAWAALECWRGEGPLPARLRRTVLPVAMVCALYFLTLLPATAVLAANGSSWHPVPSRLANYGRTFRKVLRGEQQLQPPGEAPR